MDEQRVTPERIEDLADDEIFVFGSNDSGQHGAGAALLAYQRFGAVWGQGHGPMGQSYGISTMEGFELFRRNAAEFNRFASAHPELTFLLTKVGCGIAGYTEAQVAPLFAEAPPNVVKPEGW
ncbi:hypothetical protein LWF01_16640 [Saxibacter everestensis]|uniref:Transketolase n=1 Tax=Saxibacter everestensis TaxID=2909229 RepID=A0ABY8QRR7_9MICO|nr:hypothetical protein LWF01_16640 [Brevibacteriaceae bacterium ZFBP1038]